jgi:cysteine-rich repeat protein
LFTVPILIGFAAPACSFDNPVTPTSGMLDDPSIVECTQGPDECPKIEGSDIGKAGVTLEVNGQIVTFVSFQPKEDDGGFIGFTLDTSASFIVKAGQMCFAGEGTSWTHPGGTSGPDANAISNIQICSVDEPEPFCGDGTVDAGEECDDGNNADGDGCSANCTVEPPPKDCGDGALDAGEECDDGNNVNGDGCSAVCTLEPFCGDGTVDAGEECDDGNNADGDGCSSICLNELITF